MKNHIPLLIIVIIASLTFHYSIFAQNEPPTTAIEPYVEIANINLDEFPSISGILDVRDENGVFIGTLNPTNITIIENDVSIPVQRLERQEVGVQVVMAVNLTPRFAVYYEEGVQIYEKIVSDLINWGNTLSTSQYSLSFITNEGINSKHRISPREWLRAIELYEPDYDNSSTNLDVLFTAINVASESPAQEGMGKVVFYYTSIIDPEYNDNLTSLMEQAITNNVVIYPIFVDSKTYMGQEETENLNRLAKQTGGEVIYFSDTEKMSSIDSILFPYSEVYQFEYNSAIKDTGDYEIYANVVANDLTIVSNITTISLQIEPPVPFFVDPPTEIQRNIDTENISEDGFVPIYTPIEIMIDFPDDRQREITRSALLVNGEVVVENYSQPFNFFEWNLVGFDQTGVQKLEVEVEDELGLIGHSVATMVQLTIQSTALRWQVILEEYGYLITIGIVVLTGSLLLVILIISGVIGPDNQIARKKIRKAKNESSSSLFYEPEGIRQDSRPILKSSTKKTTSLPKNTNSEFDPVTQPVDTLAKKEKKRKMIREKNTKLDLNLPRAILKKLNDDDQTIPGGAMLIFDEITKIGSDKKQADCWLNDVSIQPVHAEIHIINGDFMIIDQKTVAGTWVNYAPISSEGYLLEDGDLVHLGKFGFRFMVNKQYNKES